jgi:hypothetical protein
MPGLVPGIHEFSSGIETKTWMAGTSPAMTVEIVRLQQANLLAGA